MAWLVSLPLLGGAVLRMVAGWSADWVGARSTALAILLAELAALAVGMAWRDPGITKRWSSRCFSALPARVLRCRLPIAGRAYPPAAQGFVLGLAASGNVGTVLILFLAPRWAAVMDWHHVCGMMAGVVRRHSGAVCASCAAGTAVPGAPSRAVVAQCGGTHSPAICLLALFPVCGHVRWVCRILQPAAAAVARPVSAGCGHGWDRRSVMRTIRQSDSSGGRLCCGSAGWSPHSLLCVAGHRRFSRGSDESFASRWLS